MKNIIFFTILMTVACSQAARYLDVKTGREITCEEGHFVASMGGGCECMETPELSSYPNVNRMECDYAFQYPSGCSCNAPSPELVGQD